MSRPVVWNAQTREDLADIVAYISEDNLSEDNPLAAERLADALEASAWALPEHPYLYRVSDRMPGCREIVVHTNYILLYRVTPDCIEVLRVLHGSRVHF